MFRELDYQDCVLAGESYQHDQADLGEHVVVTVVDEHTRNGRQQAHRDDEDDGERKRQALVLSREHEEHEQHA